MRYIRVRWIHSHADEPVEIYSELDDRAWETRKVEIFPDGKIGYASSTEETDSTMLAVEPMPSLEEIAADPQFIPEEISQAEFESMWETVHQVGNLG